MDARGWQAVRVRARRTWWPRLLVGALALLAGLECMAQERFRFDRAPGLLPKTVRPQRIDLHLTLDPAQPQFQGRARMQLRLLERRAELTVHAEGLSAGEAALVDGRGRRFPLQVLEQPASQSWRLVAARPVPPGLYGLHITWTGSVKSTGEGLFRAGDARRPMLATQLQAIHARSIFPAFDEPAFRARYRVTVEAPASLQVLSNMPRLSHIEGPAGRAQHRFADTPPMPAYLVAVAVGDFDRIDGRAGRIPLSIFTERGKSSAAAYAMEVTRQVLPYYGSYFGLPYALPKLDQLAVPSTRAGAMEDWGLISYIENGLLFDPARDPPDHRRDVFSLVAHEIAHQWFGNLVTAASWNDIWLNEAFATWLAEKAEHRFNPEWQVPLLRRARLERVLTRDAGSASRAIRSGEVTEARVFEVFDGITYDKGGAVLAMLELWMGEAAFQRGLQSYMRERRLSNATAGDLWHHLGRAAGRDVRRMARAWTDRQGHPVVEFDERCEQGRLQLSLRQRPFRLDGTDGGPTTAVWPVPLRLARGREARTLMLDAASARVPAGPCTAVSEAPWVVQAGGGGFYRVRYAPALWPRILAAFPALAPVDQVGILSDVLAHVEAGAQPVTDALALIDALDRVEGTAGPVLVEAAARQLDIWRATVGPGELRAALDARGRRLLAPQLQRLGWTPREGEPTAETRLRGRLIAWLSAWGDEAVSAQAQSLFEREQRGAGEIPSAVRGPVLEAVGRRADATALAQLVRLLREAPQRSEQERLADAIGAVRDPALVGDVLALALGDTLPAELAVLLPQAVSRTPEHAAAAYAFMREHWRALAARTDAGPFGGRAWLLPAVAAGLADAAMADRLLADQRALAGEDMMTPARQIAERVRHRAAWRDRHAAALQEALRR